GNIDEHVDAANNFSLGVPQRLRIGREPHAGSIGPFRYTLSSLNYPSFLERNSHGAFIMRQAGAIGTEKLPRDAPLIAASCGVRPENSTAAGLKCVRRPSASVV